MNYSKIYEDLMLDASCNPKQDDYKESHHIVPKCMGGDDSKENLIKLTARQHYLAHWLLYKIYKTSSLVHAWHSMSRIGKGQDKRQINSHLFQYCKIERKKHLSKQSTGSGNSFYGKHHTEKTKKRLSEMQLGKIYKTEKQIKEWVESVAKKPKTKDHRDKIGRKGLGMLQHIHTKEIIRVPLTDQRFNSSDWVHPKKLNPEQKYKCDYCDIVTISGNLKRWHNDKCKRKV